MLMNKEKYNDPTADEAIAHVMKESRMKALKEKKAVKADEHKRSNEFRLQRSR